MLFSKSARYLATIFFSTVVVLSVYILQTPGLAQTTISEDRYTGYAQGSQNNIFPNFASCANGGTAYDYPDFSHWTGSTVQNYNITAPNNTSVADIQIFKQEDHPERCRYGDNNDPGNPQCDENQRNEGLVISANGSALYTAADRTGISDEFLDIRIRNVRLNAGSNTIAVDKYAPIPNIGYSTDYKIRICVRNATVPSSTPNPTPVSTPASTPPPSSSNTGTIRVCLVLQDSNQAMIDGSHEPSTSFSLGWLNPPANMLDPSFDPADGVPATTTFRTSDTLDTKIPEFPNGPGPNGNNARCRTLTNLPLTGGSSGEGDFYYDRLRVNGSSNWGTLLYNDGWTVIASLANMTIYSDHVYDGDPSNDDSNYLGDSNGHLSLEASRPNRVVTVLARYNTPVGFSATGRINVCHIMRTQPDPLNANNFTIIEPTSFPTEQFGFSWISEPSIITSSEIGPASSVPPSYTFETSPAIKGQLDTRIDSFPSGPGVNGFNARCREYSNLPLTPNPLAPAEGMYYYSPLTSSTNWTTLYHDGFTSAATPSTFDLYNATLFDSIAANDVPRNTNADGSIILESPGNLSRTLLLLSTQNATPPPPPVTNYFQIGEGNVYSRGEVNASIVNVLPSTEQFIQPNKGILFTSSINDFGRPVENVVSFYDQNANISENITYDTLLESYKKSYKQTNLNNGTVRSGVYLHSDGSTNDLEIKNGSPFDSISSGDQYVVFVPGNLYIGPLNSDDFIVPRDGKTFIAFIVKGNIGVDPSIERLEGVYITDGTFDDVCRRSNPAPQSFSGGQCGGATTYSSANQFLVEGLLSARSGFILQRINTTGDSAENFTLRPDFYFSGLDLIGINRKSWFEVTE